MSTTTAQLSGILRGILTQPTGGVVGLVDDLLAACLDHGLQIDWQPGHYRFRPYGGEWEELTDVTLPKSVFRAVLARVSVLCKEQNPNSISPYGGQCELTVGENPVDVFRVSFENTGRSQRLELIGPPNGRRKLFS